MALAAGGFIVTAVVYIFKLGKVPSHCTPGCPDRVSRLRRRCVWSAVRPGLPWNIWHMIVYWNPHSPLFEVGWCVMLYLTVLSLEFLPVPAEEFPRLAQVRPVLVRVRLPLVLWHRSFHSAPVFAGLVVSDHAVPAASAVVFAAVAAPVSGFGDRAGHDDGDL